jgi:hypothetical protein
MCLKKACFWSKEVRFTFFVLNVLLLSSTSLFAQKSEKFAVKINTSMKVDSSRESSIKQPKYQWSIIPGFMVKSKRNKWREFQFLRNKTDETVRYERPNGQGLFYSAQTRSSDYCINVIKHNDLLKKKNTKLAFFISGQSTIGYGQSSRNTTYDFDAREDNSESKYGILAFKLTTRLGYKLTDKIWIEYCRPSFLSSKLRVGNRKNDYSIATLQNRPIFDLDPTIQIFVFSNPVSLLKKGFNFAITYKL